MQVILLHESINNLMMPMINDMLDLWKTAADKILISLFHLCVIGYCKLCLLIYLIIFSIF